MEQEPQNKGNTLQCSGYFYALLVAEKRKREDDEIPNGHTGVQGIHLQIHESSYMYTLIFCQNSSKWNGGGGGETFPPVI